jgi:hypothetical protein
MVINYEPYKDDIIRLYRDHTVEEVVEQMREKGLDAS